jgi:hypothetical protein
MSLRKHAQKYTYTIFKMSIADVPEHILHNFIKEAEKIVDEHLSRLTLREYQQVVNELKNHPPDDLIVSTINYVKAKQSTDRLFANTVFSSGEFLSDLFFEDE